MPYTPHLPPPVAEEVAPPEAIDGSPIPEKPVTAVTKLLQMTLEEFGCGNRMAQVRVPWLPKTLWFVPSEEEAETLVGKGISRGRIWTARELGYLWNIPSLSCAGAVQVGLIKAELGGDVLSVELPSETECHASGGMASTCCSSCSSTRFWRSIHGVLVCPVCHPPADSSLLAGWIENGLDPDGVGTDSGGRDSA